MKTIKLNVRNVVDRPMMEIVEVDAEKSLLEQAHELIGCGMVEVVRPRYLKEPYMLLIDEEGLLRCDPKMNPIASVLYGAQDHGQFIVGNAVVVTDVLTDDGFDLQWLDEDEAYKVAGQIHQEMLRIAGIVLA